MDKIDKQNLIAQARTDLIKVEFKDIINNLIGELRDASWDFNELRFKKLKEEENLLSTIELLFTEDEKLGYTACANLHWKYDTETSKLIIDRSFVQYNLAASYNFKKLLIHEISHVIVRYFGWIQTRKHNGAHCLEFAMINYSIMWKIYGNQWNQGEHSKCFLESYDIHQDVAYPLLCISPSKFDAIIKSLEWNSLEELANLVSRLAQDIRDKSMSTEPKKEPKKEIKSIKIVLHELYSVIKYNLFQLLPNRNKS